MVQYFSALDQWNHHRYQEALPFLELEIWNCPHHISPVSTFYKKLFHSWSWKFGTALITFLLCLPSTRSYSIPGVLEIGTALITFLLCLPSSRSSPFLVLESGLSLNISRFRTFFPPTTVSLHSRLEIGQYFSIYSLRELFGAAAKLLDLNLPQQYLASCYLKFELISLLTGYSIIYSLFSDTVSFHLIFANFIPFLNFYFESSPLVTWLLLSLYRLFLSSFRCRGPFSQNFIFITWVQFHSCQ